MIFLLLWQVSLPALTSPCNLSGLWARQAALAHSADPSGDDPEDLFFNPSSLANLRIPAFSISQRPWPVYPDYSGVALAVPMGPNTALGMGMNGYRGPSGIRSPGSQVLLGGGHRMGSALAGITVRLMSPLWGSKNQSQRVGFDLGGSWRPFAMPLGFSAAILNLPIINEPDSEVMQHQFSMNASFAWSRFRVSAGVLGFEGSSSVQCGLETSVLRFMTLRMGLGSQGFEGGTVGLSGGLGVEYGPNLRLDYGATPAGYLGILQTLSMKFSFGQGLSAFVRPELAFEKAERSEGTKHREVEANFKQAAESGEFEIQSTLVSRRVRLSWQAPRGETNLRYDVTMGMLAEASFRNLNDAPLSETSWEGEMGLGGLTYYFRVRSIRPDGSPGPVSKVKAVAIP